MTIRVKLPNYLVLSSLRRRDRQQVNDCKDPACGRMTMECVMTTKEVIHSELTFKLIKDPAEWI